MYTPRPPLVHPNPTTPWPNTAPQGAGISAFAHGSASEGVHNCIVWGNQVTSGSQVETDFPVAYCCIQDWPTTAGLGNISADPRFVDAANGDFHLLPDSPCIDAGGAAYDVLDDLDGNLRPMDGVADTPPRGDGSGWDIGAFEVSGPLLPLPLPPYDLIRDALLKRIAPREGMDLNQEGAVDVADLVLALSPGS